jgi:hypothetical protein
MAGAAIEAFRTAPGPMPPAATAVRQLDTVVNPASPHFRQMIQPPAPDPVSDAPEPPLTGAMAVGGQMSATPATLTGLQVNLGPRSEQRVVLMWGKQGVLVGVERAPDWDLAGAPITVSEVEIDAVLRVLRLLDVRVKDLTGELWDGASVGRPTQAQAGPVRDDSRGRRARKSRRAEDSAEARGAAGGDGGGRLDTAGRTNGCGSGEGSLESLAGDPDEQRGVGA